ncbi:hypothetical protein ACFL3T_00520 [Patescibacteria group bacterium]
MKYKKPLILAFILLLIIIGGCSVLNYCNPDSSVDENIDAETEMVEDTENSVDELQQLIDAKNAGEEIDEDRIEELVIQIVEENEAAIATATETAVTDEEKLEQLDQLQADLLETLEEALDMVESEEIAETIEDAIEETIDTVTEVKEEIALKEETQGDPDQPETVPGDATQEEQPEDAPGEPVQTNQPETEPEIPTKNKTISSKGESK